MDKYQKELDDKMALAKQAYKGPFCCLDMDFMLQNNEPVYNVQYNSTIREYQLKSLEGPYICTIQFCPWCGTQLMKSLRNEWYDILEKEYGLDMPRIPKQEKKIPAEFKTDEWWKKRGL